MTNVGEPSLKQALDFQEIKPDVAGTKPAVAPVAAKPILKPVDTKPKKGGGLGVIIGVVVIIIAGIASGYFLSLKLGGRIPGVKSQEQVTAEGLKVGDVVGSANEKTFKDSAIGVIDRGGFEGEGSHRLEREGGESQTVYLTSSVIDLEQLVGHKVEIWGETFNAQKAAWLMDVGRVKVVELNAPKPF